MKARITKDGKTGARWRPILLCLALAMQKTQANPQGMTVVAGTAQATQQGNSLQVTTSANAYLQWNSFNIAAGENTTFQQPSATSIVFNNIHNANVSTIYGSLHANGIVVLQNSRGFYFGPNAFVEAGGLVVTTTAINPGGAGGAGWSFDGPPTVAPIVNYGSLQMAEGGSLFLIAKEIDNFGKMVAPGGTVGLVAGQEVLLSLDPNGLSLSAPVKLPKGSVNNEGQIVADAGQVLLQAQTVNNNGLVQANSVREKDGVIELYASDNISLGAASVIQANGDSSGDSGGGKIVVKSSGTFSDTTGSQINATGGAQGGNGGNVEVSAPDLLSLNSGFDAGAQPGFTDGHLSLDPTTITLSASGTTATSGTVNSSSTPSALTLNVNSLDSFSAILLQATSSITLATPWTLPDEPTGGTLTLQSGGGITFNNNDSLVVGKGWNVNLIAGAKTYTSPASQTFTSGNVTAGTGSVTLNGNAGIQSANGNITILAGSTLTVGTGKIATGIDDGAPMTTPGGSISVMAVGSSTATWTVNPNSFSSESSITLETQSAMSISAPWNLPDTSAPATLTLQAGGSTTSGIALNNNLTAGENWNVNLMAGENNSLNTLSMNAANVIAGKGNVTLSGTATIQTANGNINILAGNNLSVGSGKLATGIDNGLPTAAAGGAIDVLAVGTSSGNWTLTPGWFSSSSAIWLATSSGMTLSTPWALADNAMPASLTLEAGGTKTAGITVNNSGSLTAGLDWTVNLIAGANTTGLNLIANGNYQNSQLINSANVTSGNGPISLSGSDNILSSSGGINILSGLSVTVGSGRIVTGMENGAVMASPGGSIDILAVSGNVNAGSGVKGYDFQTSGAAYVVDSGLSGISTASGGNVVIQAGGNITSAYSPGGSSVHVDYGSGAFGPEPGNVSLTAGGTVSGAYFLANGSGNISAANCGTATAPFALNLIDGNWLVNATQNIFLQEVRNPNGIFNFQPGPNKNLIDYGPLDAVALNAGGGVTITGTSLPRANSEEGMIFPPSLTIDAGPGGISLEQPVSLFPSPEGQLVMNTTGGGNLTGNTLVMSDSQATQWTGNKSFTAGDLDGSDNVMHLNDPNPVQMDISGSITGLVLTAPKPVEIYAGGNIVDCSATFQNLRPSDTSVISAGGYILDHTPYVLLTLPAGVKPDYTALNFVALQNIPGPGGISVINPNYVDALNNAGNNFIYNAKTGGLEYAGPMNYGTWQAFLAMTTPFLPASIINTIYYQSLQEPTTGQAGFNVAGPGALQVRAASISLGNGQGINSIGIQNNLALAPYTARGANLDISTTGDLNMIASTIESGYGGQINISCGGSIDVGSLLVPAASTEQTLGIISLWGGDINVLAVGDIDVDGSRIGAYDGGNVFVESLDGNVNAGTGGAGSALTEKYYIGAEGQRLSLDEVIPGSGIVATSYPQLVYAQTTGSVGDITVETPEGNISAAKGGIMQLALGPTSASDDTITLTAGSRNSDGTVAHLGDVDASGSGVVGGHVNISATGNINGLVVASLSASLSALQNVSATVLSSGTASVSAGGTVSGTVVGVGNVAVSGASDVAAAFSAGGVTTSGAQSGAAVAAGPTGTSSASAAATTQQVNQTTQASAADTSNSDDEEKKKKKKGGQLMQYEGRVTVILPPK